MDRIFERGMLYDFYGELLNDKQREYFEDYYFNNLSLGEISENTGLSRNAMHKNIKMDILHRENMFQVLLEHIQQVILNMFQMIY